MSTTSVRDLVARLAALVSAEHGALADFVLLLAEFDREERWRELGHVTLFAFLVQELHLPGASAFFRQTAARLVQRFPEVAEALRDGRLCVSTVVELSKVMTEQNRGEVLPRFFTPRRRRPRLSPRSCARARMPRRGPWSPRCLRPARPGRSRLRPLTAGFRCELARSDFHQWK